jgi:hypothetical protein
MFFPQKAQGVQKYERPGKAFPGPWFEQSGEAVVNYRSSCVEL